MKIAITSGLIIGMAVVLLHALINLAIYGEVLIKEPHVIILVAEISLMVFAILWGVLLFLVYLATIRRE
ncbi:hypothetical protein LCGC14_2310180 [marine sediment metagenome]|uniref:Uncharacterized protein n=1 Tax=marine sediment metagenome TaxID=412755 RepID=A0A0F9D8D7_9ZZZZ